MIRFLAKRLTLAVGILLAISVFIYAMLDLALDPLENLRDSTAPNKAQLIADRIRSLHLDEPWFTRYGRWLANFVTGNPGVAWTSKEPVASHLGPAIGTSVQLVFVATLLAILTGVTIGILSALRQYTGFDYAITFLSFLLYSLPVFWVAVLLKQFLAIGMNDYLQHPTISWPFVLGLSLVAALFMMGALGGSLKRKAMTFGMAFVIALALLWFVLGTDWLLRPYIGIIGIALIAMAAAFGMTALFAGLQNKRALYSSITTAVIGIAMYLPLQWVFYYLKNVMNLWWLGGLLVIAIAIACLVGWLYGGPDRAVSMRNASLVALIISAFVFVDKMLQNWYQYSHTPGINGRPIATIGPATPGLKGDFWMMQVDRFTHLLLPTVALVLISFATYTRYQRGSMLEVLNQDYIRTARAKGLPERVVIVRHALRNALMPLASIVPVDLIGMIGGAIMTESIFGWSGMGKYFIDSMRNQEIDPCMAYVMLVGLLAMIANLVADFLYALLDPRIRVNA